MSAYMFAPTIPVHLEALFEMMDFIASAKKGSKPCFNGLYYVDATSWTGAFYRLLKGEKQSGRGNMEIRKCCEEAAQAYEQYKNTPFKKVILEKMVKLRNGIISIRGTYENDDSETATVNHLTNSILVLDMRIPQHILLEQGIIPRQITHQIPIPQKKESNLSVSSSPHENLIKRLAEFISPSMTSTREISPLKIDTSIFDDTTGLPPFPE